MLNCVMDEWLPIAFIVAPNIEDRVQSSGQFIPNLVIFKYFH